MKNSWCIRRSRSCRGCRSGSRRGRLGIIGLAGRGIGLPGRVLGLGLRLRSLWRSLGWGEGLGTGIVSSTRIRRPSRHSC